MPRANRFQAFSHRASTGDSSAISTDSRATRAFCLPLRQMATIDSFDRSKPSSATSSPSTTTVLKSWGCPDRAQASGRGRSPLCFAGSGMKFVVGCVALPCADSSGHRSPSLFLLLERVWRAPAHSRAARYCGCEVLACTGRAREEPRVCGARADQNFAPCHGESRAL